MTDCKIKTSTIELKLTIARVTFEVWSVFCMTDPSVAMRRYYLQRTLIRRATVLKLAKSVDCTLICNQRQVSPLAIDIPISFQKLSKLDYFVKHTN